MQAIRPYDRLAQPVLIAWMFALLFFCLILVAARQFIAALLMKLYEELILHNPATG